MAYDVINAGYLEVILSGGAANEDPALSIGDAISTAGADSVVRSRTLTRSTSVVTGVTALDAPGSALGEGTLTYDKDTTTLTWEAVGETAGTGVDVSGAGTLSYYLLPSGTAGYLLVSVAAASLPVGTGTVADNITVAAKANALFDDISSVESWAGMTDYRCVYLKNTHDAAPMVVQVYIGSQPSGTDTLEIGLAVEGKNGTAELVADENTAPATVVFSAPASAGTALDMGTLAAGDYYPLWIKRDIAAETATSEAVDLSALAFVVAC